MRSESILVTIELETMMAGRGSGLSESPERVLRFTPSRRATRRHGHFALALFGLMGPCNTANKRQKESRYKQSF